MEKVFDNKFHKQYVGGVENIKEVAPSVEPIPVLGHVSLEQVLAEYREYVNDPTAELPEEILKTFLANQRTENVRK